MFNRSAILRAAHVGARWLLARCVFPRTYRDALAEALRSEWRKAKEAAAYAARMALLDAEEAAEAIALPADVTQEIADLRLIAETQSFSSYGNQQRRLLLAQADDIERAARCIMIPAQDTFHVAH